MKKSISMCLVALLLVSLLAGCSSADFDKAKGIKVISREDGSGTRGAFIELFGIEVKGDDGTRKDMTTKEAVIAKQTDVMITNITNDKYAIGYVSLGSLNDSVTAVSIEGVTATQANVMNGSYPIVRPFNIATQGQASGLAEDFILFITSAEGQEVIAKSYIGSVDNPTPYSGTKPAGTLIIAGSSSVAPIMEKLIEAYALINPAATLQLQASDSSAGLIAAREGICDIAMSSRALNASESQELVSIQIALDGIAVIVHNENPASALTKDQVKAIFTGAEATWAALVS